MTASPLNHGIGRIVREADPKGNAVEHVVMTRRMIDALYDNGNLGSEAEIRYDAAKVLRQYFDDACPRVGNVGAVDPSMPHIGGGQFAASWRSVRDEAAWHSYIKAMRELGQWQNVVRAVVIEDEHPDTWGRRSGARGMITLHAGLDALAKIFGTRDVVSVRIRGWRAVA